MTEPKNVTKVRCFMGLVTHLGKYLPNLAERSKLLRDRLNKYTSWYWGPQQCKAFTVIKKGAVNPTLPGFADTSSYGLGAVLLQRNRDADWQPVAYTSQAHATTEQRYCTRRSKKRFMQAIKASPNAERGPSAQCGGLDSADNYRRLEKCQICTQTDINPLSHCSLETPLMAPARRSGQTSVM